jgi:type II secretory pathway pseudopilin PulG
MASTIDAALRNANHIVIFGTSREQANDYDAPTNKRKSAAGPMNQAIARMGGRLKVVARYGGSGQRTDQFLSAANLAAAIATDARYAYIGGIVNDVAVDATILYFITVVAPACEILIAAGIIPILTTEPGQTNQAGNTAARTAYQRYNNMIRQYVDRKNGQAIVFDLAAIVLDLTTATIAFKANYGSDNTHWNTVLAATVIGKAFAALMLPLVPAVNIRKPFGGELPALGLQGFANPGFITGTGGTITASTFTGTAPAGVTSTSFGTTAGSGSLAVSANADGSNDLVVAMTAAAAGNFRVSMDIAAGFDNPGDLIDICAQAEVVTGDSKFSGPYLNLEDRGDSVSDNWSSLYADNTLLTGAGFAANEILDHYLPVVVKAKTVRNWFSVSFNHYFNAAGSATVKWRHLAVDKRQALA